MIHKNRGNRRWVDKRKRRHKYNLVQKIWGDAMYFLDGILGKYDKGKIHDINHAEKTNGKVSQKGGQDNVSHVGSLGRFDNNYRHADKKKVECCNDKLRDYEDGWAEIDAMTVADVESYYDWERENKTEVYEDEMD